MSKREFPQSTPAKSYGKNFFPRWGSVNTDSPRRYTYPPRRINEIVLEKRGITADTAIRLGLYFTTTAQFWLNLQARYELEVARESMDEKEIRPFHKAA